MIKFSSIRKNDPNRWEEGHDFYVDHLRINRIEPLPHHPSQQTHTTVHFTDGTSCEVWPTPEQVQWQIDRTKPANP